MSPNAWVSNNPPSRDWSGRPTSSYRHFRNGQPRPAANSSWPFAGRESSLSLSGSTPPPSPGIPGEGVRSLPSVTCDRPDRSRARLGLHRLGKVKRDEPQELLVIHLGQRGLAAFVEQLAR